MKNLFRIPFVMFIASLILMGCSKDEVIESDSILLEDSRITNSIELEVNDALQADSDFQELISLKEDLFCLLIIKLEENPNINEELGFINAETVELESAISYLEMTEEYEGFLTAISYKSELVKDEFQVELEALTDEEVYYNLEVATENFISPCDDHQETQDNCDDQFQADMKAISDAYDAAVNACTASLLQGNLAYNCYGVATTNAIFQSAMAIDRHTCCKQNNEYYCEV